MQLEKILEEIESVGNIQFSSYTKPLIAVEDVIKIIRAHISCENAAEIERSSRDNDGWIPVEERLPEEGTQVIVTTEDGMVYGDIVYGYADETDSDPCFHRWDDEYWQCFKPIVIAWRPLPEPYRPERSESKAMRELGKEIISGIEDGIKGVRENERD